MGQIDLKSLNLAHRILLGGAAVLFIVMFFTWQGVTISGTTIGVSGWHGFNGVLLGIFTLALLLWEVSLLVGEPTAELRKRIPLEERLVSAGLGAGVLVLGVLKFLTASQLRRWPEWVGLIVSLAIGYGAWLVYSQKEPAAEVVEAPTV